MKITVQDGAFIYAYDDSLKNTIENGFVKEGYTSVNEAIDAALLLLTNCYSGDEIAKCIQKMDFNVMDCIMEK